ncbi:hypothetical protein V2J09_000029 [Rumex salicifolius]
MANLTAEPWRSLEGKTVMVTGASSGIGLELCLDLAKAGCNVIAAARRIQRLESLCDQINRISAGRAVAVELDVSTDGKSIEASIRRGWDAFGRIDALINNAGVRGTVSCPMDLSEEEWNTTVRTNLTGTWLVSKYVGIQMRDAKMGGSIINVASIAGINRGQLPGGIAYSASKAAVNMITKVMALEFGPYRIRVNAINPGLFRSEITQGLMEKEWLQNVAKRTTPLQSNGTVDPALTSTGYFWTNPSNFILTLPPMDSHCDCRRASPSSSPMASSRPCLHRWCSEDYLLVIGRLVNYRVLPSKTKSPPTQLGPSTTSSTSISRFRSLACCLKI